MTSAPDPQQVLPAAARLPTRLGAQLARVVPLSRQGGEPLLIRRPSLEAGVDYWEKVEAATADAERADCSVALGCQPRLHT